MVNHVLLSNVREITEGRGRASGFGSEVHNWEDRTMYSKEINKGKFH